MTRVSEKQVTGDASVHSVGVDDVVVATTTGEPGVWFARNTKEATTERTAAAMMAGRHCTHHGVDVTA
jgi:hypothetical protein